MISVTFTNDVENIVATEHLYQWDNGQKLSISGVGTTADIHFANKKSEKALVVTPTVTSDAMEAPIPNSLLAEPYPIIAYVYVPSDDGARTLKTVTIAVEARKQPSDFVLDEDEGITTIETISQRVNEVLQNATNQINTSISDMQTDYTNFKNTIQGELDDMVANTTIPNADTLDGKHASDFALKTDIPTSLPANGGIADTARQTVSPNEKAMLWEDHEGGNLRLVSADGNHSVEIDLFDNSFRMVFIDNGELAFAAGYDHTTKKFNINGNANTASTAGALATTPTNVCLRNISFGTAGPQVTDPNAEGYVAEGALYGQYT